MKTPRFFSHPIAGKLLPEVIGEKFTAKAEPIWAAADYRCQLSQYNYRPELEGAPCWLMLEPRDHLSGKGKAERRPASQEEITQAYRRHGVTSKTTQAVDPLLFWARHVDLAIKYRRGTLIFAPWITQSELLTLFRGATIGMTQENFPGAENARQILLDMDIFGNDEIMKEVTATSSLDEPWNSGEWLNGIRKLPLKERRAYLSEFGVNLRFWPDHTVFRPVIEQWKRQVNVSCNSTQNDTGNPWFNHYMELFAKLQSSSLKKAQ